MGHCEQATIVPAIDTQVAWQDMCSSYITDTCPPGLHLTVMPADSQFDTVRAVACVNAVIRLLLQWSSQKEVSQGR
jgi:hypothetical protein